MYMFYGICRLVCIFKCIYRWSIFIYRGHVPHTCNRQRAGRQTPPRQTDPTQPQTNRYSTPTWGCTQITAPQPNGGSYSPTPSPPPMTQTTPGRWWLI